MTIDHALQRLRLSSEALDALCLLVDPDTSPAGIEAAWQTLTAAGVATERRLPGWIAELAEVVAAPGLRIVVEVSAGDAVVVHQLWATPRRAVVSTPIDDQIIELRGLETAMLPFELARIVGLGPRPVPTDPASITLAATALAAAIEALETHGREHARQILVEHGSSAHHADLVADICTCRHTTWRVTSVWKPTPDSQTTRALTVVDAGDAGLWLSEPDDPRDTGTSVTLTATRPSRAWRQLLDLLPTMTPKEATAHG